MNSLLKSTFLLFNKIKIVHSIPGRVRLQIPWLDKVPDNMKQYDRYTTSIIKMHKGIKSVEYSYTTGRILILYDAELTNEKEIVSWLNYVWEIIVENEHLYKGMSAQEIENNLENFYNMLYKKLQKI